MRQTLVWGAKIVAEERGSLLSVQTGQEDNQGAALRPGFTLEQSKTDNYLCFRGRLYKWRFEMSPNKEQAHLTDKIQLMAGVLEVQC